MSVNGVEGIFLGQDFISINKYDEATWDDIKYIVISLINDFYSSGKEFVIDKNPFENDTNLGEIEKNRKNIRSKNKTSCCKRRWRYKI